MKRSVMTAVLFAGISGSAFAGSSHVQLYGIIDAGITHFSGISNGSGGTTSSTGLSSGVETPDRIGLKGTEDLGNGLATVFDIETGFCGTGLSQDASSGQKIVTGPANGYCTGGGFMQRQAWVELKGGLGAVRLGRDFTILFREEVQADPFTNGLNGDMFNLSLSGKQSGLALSHANQAVEYFSPEVDGLSFDASYSFAPLNGGTIPLASGNGSQVPRSWGVVAHYSRGGFLVGTSYTRVSNDPFGVGAGAGGTNDGSIGIWTLRGSYDFPAVHLSALYEKATGSYAYGASAGQSGGANSYWMIGAKIPLGRSAILMSTTEAHVDSNSVLMPASVYGTAKEYAVGYTYALSKQTALYASYGHISNGPHTAFAVGSATDVMTGVVGEGSSGFAVGLRHSF